MINETAGTTSLLPELGVGMTESSADSDGTKQCYTCLIISIYGAYSYQGLALSSLFGVVHQSQPGEGIFPMTSGINWWSSFQWTLTPSIVALWLWSNNMPPSLTEQQQLSFYMEKKYQLHVSEHLVLFHKLVNNKKAQSPTGLAAKHQL